MRWPHNAEDPGGDLLGTTAVVLHAKPGKPINPLQLAMKANLTNRSIFPSVCFYDT